MQASHKLAEEMYKQHAGQSQAEPGPQPGPQPGETKTGDSGKGAVDADFEVVDDDKKG